MNKILHLFLPAFLLFSLESLAQAIANPPENIVQCDNIFDLTQVTPTVLGAQSPSTHTVSFYTSVFDAQNNLNLITNPDEFVVSGTWTTIAVKVTNNATSEYAITDFQVHWAQAEGITWVDEVVCGGTYQVPDFSPFATYVLGPESNGIQYVGGEVIDTTETFYLQTVNEFGCTAVTSFTVTITPGLEFDTPTPLYRCYGNLAPITDFTEKFNEIVQNDQNYTFTLYNSEASALLLGSNAWPNPHLATTVGQYNWYMRITDTTTGCYGVVMITVIGSTTCTENTLIGKVTYDIDNNGCTVSDAAAAGIPVHYISGDYHAVKYTDAEGQYIFYNLPNGTGSVSIEEQGAYTVSPVSQGLTFNNNTTASADFCLTVPNPVNDVAVTLIPLSAAQAGFPTQYALHYENNGSLPASGTVTLTFDAANLTYNSSSPVMTGVSGTTLVLPYNLQPFQSGVVTATFTVNVPQITPAGTVLSFTATIDPVTEDSNQADNICTLEEVVVNSWDPNDITVHEGESITPEQADEYLHYTIRFQNEGSANAVNIRIEVPIDEKLNLSTLEPLASSHNYSTIIRENEIEFVFNNINLTWSDNNEPASHGYVTYRIKPLSSVGIGDIIQGGSAGIFFDFNDPVMTNVVTTTIQSTMSVEDITSNGLVLYPNPASEIVTLQFDNMAENTIDVAVTNILGKTLVSNTLTVSNSAAVMDISFLETGVYFVTLTSGGKALTEKLVIK